MKEWIIDRIEENFAIIECEGEFFEVNLKLLPELSEGDQIQIQRISPESEETSKLEEAQARLERLKQRSEPPPDVFDL